MPKMEQSGVVIPVPVMKRLEMWQQRYQRMMAQQRRGSQKIETTPSKRQAKAFAWKTSKKIDQVRANWCHQVSRALADQSV